MQSSVNDPKNNIINGPGQQSNHAVNAINERGPYYKETPSIRRIDSIEYGTYRRAKKVRNEPQDHRKTLVIFAQPNTRSIEVKMDVNNIYMGWYLRLEEEETSRLWIEQGDPKTDQTINLNIDDFGHESNEDENNKKKKNDNKNAKKHKRKPSEGICNLLSECWKYFDPKMERPDGPLIRMGYCKFCPQVYRADPVKNDTNGDGEGCSSGTLQNWKYDEKAIKKSLIELIVLAELPFKFVQHPAFIKYSKNLQPKYTLPSRHTISRDVSKFYLEEKKEVA
ncbi:zinc finger BED domain-containing protein RICESLEEPER 2 [Tanacetum coccineum]